MAGMVIIGAGECGVRAGFALREQGYGGTVTLIGAETALPYERPPLSKTSPPKEKPIRKVEAFGEADIDFRRGVNADSIDREAKTVALSDGGTLTYEKLLIATGARARLFPGMEGCLTLRTCEDAEAIVPRFEPGVRVGIVGGGFIGLELAGTARGAGAEVTVIEAAPALMARAVPGEIAAAAQARHEAEGVTLKLDTKVASATATGITLAKGEALPFDLVIAGVGSLPDTALASAAGLKVEDGIVVDETLRTSDPHIFAAGDCCRFPWRGASVRLESWKAAQDQGAHAAAAMLGAEEPYAKVPYFWSDQYDMTLQVAGLFDPALPVHRRDTGDETRLVFQCDGTLRAAAGIGPGNAVAKDIRIFEKLIEREARLDPATLADPATNLKKLLKAA